MFLFKRKDVYYVEFYDINKQKKSRLSTGKTTKTAALEFVSNLRKKLIVKPETMAITLSTFREKYLEYTIHLYTLKYIKSIRLSFRVLEEFLGDPVINTITDQDIERFLVQTYRKAKHAAHLYKRTLNAAFNKGISWKYINHNPFSNFKNPKIIKQFPITVSEVELNCILDQVRIPGISEAILIAYFTGMRQNEIANLKWVHINLDEKIIIVKNSSEFTTKSKNERLIPISKRILPELIKMHENKYSDYVISTKHAYKYHPDTISHKFKEAVRKAGLSEEIHFHSLRHSFASNLVRQGVSLYIVKQLLGHSDISTTQIYSHLDTGSLKDAIEIL